MSGPWRAIRTRRNKVGYEITFQSRNLYGGGEVHPNNQVFSWGRRRCKNLWGGGVCSFNNFSILYIFSSKKMTRSFRKSFWEGSRLTKIRRVNLPLLSPPMEMYGYEASPTEKHYVLACLSFNVLVRRRQVLKHSIYHV